MKTATQRKKSRPKARQKYADRDGVRLLYHYINEDRRQQTPPTQVEVAALVTHMQDAMLAAEAVLLRHGVDCQENGCEECRFARHAWYNLEQHLGCLESVIIAEVEDGTRLTLGRQYQDREEKIAADLAAVARGEL